MAMHTQAANMPTDYYQELCAPEPEPPFQDASELKFVWKEVWGASDDVGRLRMVLMRAPGDEFSQIKGDAWDSSVGALVDPNGGWYWRGEKPPDVELLREQHNGLVRAIEAEGVEVVLGEPLPPRFTKAIYTRDPLVTVRGGAIVGRMAPRMRRGEELSVTRTLGNLGVPILRTIIGKGMLEGGTFVKLTPTVAAYGLSIRCNQEGADQLQEVLVRLGIELVRVPLFGYKIHLDSQMIMVDVDKAVVNGDGLPYWFLERLHELGIQCIWRDPTERWAQNCLAVRPGRVIMSQSSPRTADLLSRQGIEVVQVPFDEVEKNGGSVHCSTMELLREDGQ